MLQDNTLLGGLYQIRLSDTHFYGGRTFCFKNRWADHLKNLKEGKANQYMQNVYNKYGRFEPEILEILPREKCIEAEQAWLDKHYRTPGCVNLNPSACGGDGRKSSEETRARMSAAMRSDPERMKRAREILLSHRMKKGFKHSPASLEKNRLGHIGIKQSPESIAKRVRKITGRKNSPEILAKMSESAKIRAQKYPVHFSEATRALLSQQQKGRVWLNNGSMNIRVPSSQVQSYLDQGWVQGRFGSRSPESRALTSEQSKDRIWLTDGNKNLFVKPDQVESLQSEGWTQGRSNVKPVAQEARDRSGAKRHGRVWATDGTDNLLVSPEEIPEGWYIGLTKKLPVFTDEAKAALSAKRRNKRWVYDTVSGRSTSVDETDLPRYLDEGWALGRMASAGAN